MRPYSAENVESQHISVTNNENVTVNMSNPREVGGCFGPRANGPSPFGPSGEMCFSNPYEHAGQIAQMGMMGAEMNQMQHEINQLNMNPGSLYGSQNMESNALAPVQSQSQSAPENLAQDAKVLEKILAPLIQELQGNGSGSAANNGGDSPVTNNGSGSSSSSPLSAIASALGGATGGSDSPITPTGSAASGSSDWDSNTPLTALDSAPPSSSSSSSSDGGSFLSSLFGSGDSDSIDC